MRKNTGNSYKKKSEFLGMSLGTANYRLHRKLLFHLVCKLGENKCYRCSEKIESIESFSIEHKESWLDVDSSLYWDMENIAFSHFGCNSRHTSRLKTPPDGHAWCTDCKSFLPKDEFWVMSDGKTYSKCKTCKNTRQTKYRKRVGRK